MIRVDPERMQATLDELPAFRGRLVALCDAMPVAFYDLHRCAIAWGRMKPGESTSFGPFEGLVTARYLIVPNMRRRRFDLVAAIAAPVAPGARLDMSPASFVDCSL